MNKILIAIFCTAILSCFSFQAAASADSKEDKVKREQWYKNMVQTKIDYIAKQVGMNADQKGKFEKQYAAMSAETAKLSRETRQLERTIAKKANATDVEYEKAAEAIAEFKSKEGAIEQKYFNQFKTYLSKKQLFQLKVAEHKWMKELMKHRNKGGK
ncbi:MAG: hypothetical protein K2G01_09740 [Paramuribaculum sp.]|nr:hypothetical protein [Paramuribaculum sp.]MDE6323710.1 hypothetical protein [Paramuribaculum sp.]